MKNSKRCLVILMSPIHVIASLCAIRTLNNSADFEVDILVNNPAASDDVNRELVGVVKQLTSNFSFIGRISTLQSSFFKMICTQKNIVEASSALKEMLRENEYQEIYYAHDVMGFLYQLACITYGEAERICYGDALGIVFDKQFKLSLGKEKKKQNILITILRKTQSFVRNLRNLTSLLTSKRHNNNNPSLQNQLQNKEFKPDLACLVIPIDYSGSFIKDIPLIVPRKKMVMNIISQIKISCKNIDDYIESFLIQFESRNKVLLLTENFAEARRISFEQEIKMWCSIVKTSAEQGSVIFLKSHPGELLPRNEAIKKKLSGQYEVVILSSKYSRYPIELWEKLVLSSKVLSMSYPCISLKYFYGINVVNSFNNDFIEKWFPETSWKLYKYNEQFFSEPVEKLNSWDGHSVIWSGKH